MSEEKVIYFKKRDPNSTNKVLEVTREYADTHNIHTILVATTKGQTGVDASKIFSPSK